MLDEVYFQTTPIPDDLHPPVEMEVIAYAADARRDPMTAFIDSEKEAFDAWTDHLPLGHFDFVTGYPTRFLLFVTMIPKEEEDPLRQKVKGLLDDIYSGAVYGDVGTTIDGVSMGQRARWIVSTREPDKKSSQETNFLPLIFTLLLITVVLVLLVLG